MQEAMLLSSMRQSVWGSGMLPRDWLVDMVLARQEPIVVLDAAAGMGKSTLLAQLARRLGTGVHLTGDAPAADEAAIVLWDLPPNAHPQDLPEAFIAGVGRIIIGKRPHTIVPGLLRANAYGKVFTLDTHDLSFSRGELARHFAGDRLDAVLDQTGGWPLLLGQAGNPGTSAGDAAEFLRYEFLEPMRCGELFAVRDLLNGRSTLSEAAKAPLPLGWSGDDSKAAIVPNGIRGPLKIALDAVMAVRVRTQSEAMEIARAYAERGEMTEAIVTFQNAGCLDEALATFSAASDRFFIYTYGSAAFDRVLAGFPEQYAQQSDVIVMSLAVQALKRGEVSRARQLLAQRFGPAANDLSTVFSDKTAYTPEFLAFRVVMLIYEDYLLTDTLFEQVFGMLGAFSPDAHLVRGSFYNSVLEFYIRGRRFAAAEDVATQALHHYEQANVPMLAFYICLHQALISLMQGDAVTARRHAGAAAGKLERLNFESPNDERLLTLLNACIDYEGGKAEPLARFLSVELEEFAHGEIWPSLVEFALQYGSQALSDHFSTIAARNFLDRWRVYQIRNRQFGMMIEMREAAILQNGNRWQEAAEKLAPVPSRISRSWVMAASDELGRLQERDEIALALSWLRHLVYEMPTRPNLDRQLESTLTNLNLTGRQRMGVAIWLAFVSKRQRNLSKARAILQKTFEDAARLGAIAPLAEERVFLRELIEHQLIGQFLDTSGPVRQVLRRLRDNGLPNSSLGVQNGLSRRETRVLLMISEGASNKFIANALGLSEATVKFHLGNLYRKLGCKKRREAISAARALGW
jgi:ATP/maltotriose-dependent transcriptional regulator MalT